MNYNVSVALCTFNGSEYIAEQLESILKQSELPDEIVIGDDCSTDNTLTIVKNILEKNKYQNYKILDNKVNYGVTKNFERTIKSCANNIILTSDQDDIWMPNKVELIKNEFIRNPNISLIFTDALLVDKNLNSLNLSLWKSLNYKGLSTEDTSLFDVLLNRCVVTGATMAIKYDFLSEENIIFSENWLHDGWLGIVTAAHKEVAMIREPLILYRQHETNVVGANKKSVFRKIISFFSNFNSLDTIRQNKLNRYTDVAFYMEEKKMDQSVEYKKLKECQEFWQRKVNLTSLNRKNSIFQILKDWKNGSYKKYYNGNLGMVRDLISSIK